MKRRRWVMTGVVVVVALAACGTALALSAASPATPAASAPSAPTVKVAQETLSATVAEDGVLTYQAQPDGSPYAVINQASGIYTELPSVGVVISRGQVLYRVNDSPVVLLYGSTPAYRTLTAGATGADVAELNADLVALGYATSAQVAPAPSAFGSATTTGLERLQASLGVTQTGTLPSGQAVFEPTAVRVTVLSAQPGGSAQSGQTVLQATSTTRQVQVALDASQQTDVAVGDQVSMTLPNNQTTPGVVSSVGTVATCPGSSGSSGPGTSSAAMASGSCASASGSTTPKITVDVSPTDPAATGTWDQAPVQVGITTARVPSALVVPVIALLAQPGGGYAVEVVRAGGTSQLAAVSLGLFDDADGLVQVTGTGVAAGQDVVVPTT